MNLASVHAVSISLLLLSQRILAAEDECYCNSGSDCVNNRCLLREQVVDQCSVEVVRRNGSYALQYLCLDGLLSCFSSPTQPRSCCIGNSCNRCLVPPGTSYHMAVDLILPEGCPPLNITPPVTEPPTVSEDISTNERIATVTDASDSSLSAPVRISIIILSVLVLVLIIILSAVIIFVSLCRRRKQRVRKVTEIEDGESVPPYEFSYPPDDESRPDSSGAMTGNRKGQLEQRTITRIVKKKHLIAKGGFGEVWYGVWDDKPVAIKVFSPLGEESWRREEEIYRTNMLNHDHILRVMACDSYTNAFGIEHWLIMEYHDNGSLCEYLQRNTLTINDLQRILYSISDGLSFLHKPVTTSYARSHKPGIAHRDLKTRNILMKRDRTCCIADLGLAVRSNDFENSEKLPKPQQGTKRILAPEILGDTINRTQFQSYCQADVYSMGLVMWECARRTPVQGEILEYELPYQNCVSKDPSFEDMRRVVVDCCIRPPIDVRWKQDPTLSVVAAIMQECWRSNPEGRLSTARIKKKIRNLSLHTKNHLNGLSSMKLDGDMSLTATQMSFRSQM